jgi:hypothetical protein
MCHQQAMVCVAAATLVMVWLAVPTGPASRVYLARAAGEEELQAQLDELNETRNLLLAYRLLHYNDKIPNIKLNIQNREKQLFKSVIRVFQNTETLKELLPVISKYISQKREGNATTLYAFLYRMVKDLIKEQNSLESSSIWSHIIDNLSGDFIPGKKYSFDSLEFGIISQKFIIETLCIFLNRPSSCPSVLAVAGRASLFRLLLYPCDNMTVEFLSSTCTCTVMRLCNRRFFDFFCISCNSTNLSNVRQSNGTVVGPFRYTTEKENEAVMIIVESDSDPSIIKTINNSISCQDFVPFDNNIGMRLV